MYDIRQFKPALYVLLLLGISGFAIAAQSPGIWLLGCGATCVNAWLVRSQRYSPMPRLASNVITILTLLYVVHEVFSFGTTPVMVIGEFLVLLQLVKLYEVRSNRDYGQLLVLGLLLMVAASINTASLFFGIILIFYLFLSLYCCLLFHLKIEADAAKAAMPFPEEKISPTLLRQDQRHLTQSMRRLTGIVSCIAIASGAIVFLLFPRGTGAGLLGPLQFRPSQALAGFSDEVGFQQVAKIQQNSEIVAYVHLTHNGRLIEGSRPLLLRGVALDHYGGADPVRGAKWQWMRTPTDEMPQLIDRDQPTELQAAAGNHDQWVQDVTLHPTGTNVLFAMGGPISFVATRPLRMRFAVDDGAIQTAEPLVEPLEYQVVSSNDLGPPPARDLKELARQIDQPRDLVTEWADDASWKFGTGPFDPGVVERIKQWAYERKAARFGSGWAIDPKIGEFARRLEVSGSDAAGALAARRGPGGIAGNLDATIASNIERYLRTHFKYTLDLTDARRIEDRDPIVAFLYDWQRGHCEYFAGAMTLMCQSLGMEARMVVGFRVPPDEYNGLGKYYIVRQSAAHAWVEVRTASGWQSYDPTSDTDADKGGRTASSWQKVLHVLDYLEFTYANKVIAYDNDDRESLIRYTENKLLNLLIRGSGTNGFQRLTHSSLFWKAVFKISSTLLGVVVWLMVMALVVATIAFLWEKWTLRRRAARIGIRSLPHDEQMRLAQQLGFYDDLLLLLDRHRISRPNHLTPMEFSESLLYLPSDVYAMVLRLTRLFYRVRYGRVELSPAQRRRLDNVIARIGAGLSLAREGDPQFHG